MQRIAKVGRKRKILYLFGEKWNKGKENAESSIGPTFSFPPKLEGNREKRESVIEHEENARYFHFLFLIFVSTLEFFFFPPPFFQTLNL